MEAEVISQMADWLSVKHGQRYTLATLPEPLDPRVKLREVPEQTVAVIQYSGTWSQSNYDEHLGMLKNALSQTGIATVGEPVYSRYNAPFTPWFLRTNEIPDGHSKCSTYGQSNCSTPVTVN